MCITEHNFDEFSFKQQPGYNEREVREAFAKAVPLKTVVIYCYDPRAVDIPAAVARELDQVYPGDVIVDDEGNKVASTTTIFDVVVAGGRAIDAQRSVTVAQHLFGIENIVVVHHSHCGATSFTADGIIGAHRHEQGKDIAEFYQRESICITDYNDSLKHDTQLLRASPGTPANVNIFGYFYDIDSGKLTKVVEDLAA